MANVSERYGGFAYYYDKLMDDIDYQAWSDYILQAIRKNDIEYTDILEMACGTGTMAVNLSSRGYDVTAFDLSEDMLSIACSKALENNAKVNFLLQDMVDIKINNDFGIILCLCDSINYITSQEDLLNIFKWVYNHLKPNGIFIFDINSSYKLRNIIGNNTFTGEDDNLVYIWDNNINEEDIVEFYLTFFVKEGRLYRRFDEFHAEKIYESQDIFKMLKISGFNEVCAKDGLTFNDMTQNSERISFIALKI
jgi:2-polyprenyl-3-methyl-5-hydroxy-6-metoxy-1,4-benzoquinol methylase